MPDYLDWSLKLSHPGTVIIGDNVVRDGKVVDANTDDPHVRGVQRFLELAANNPRLSATAVPTVGARGYDGFAVAVCPRMKSLAKAERLLHLLQTLRRHRYPVTGNELSTELGVSLRTLYRDIAALTAQGAHIDGSPGVGYLLRPGFLLPPLMLTQEEIEALVLGSRWVSRNGDEELQAAAQDLLAKIESILPAELRQEIASSGLMIGPQRERRCRTGSWRSCARRFACSARSDALRGSERRRDPPRRVAVRPGVV